MYVGLYQLNRAWLLCLLGIVFFQPQIDCRFRVATFNDPGVAVKKRKSDFLEARNYAMDEEDDFLSDEHSAKENSSELSNDADCCQVATEGKKKVCVCKGTCNDCKKLMLNEKASFSEQGSIGLDYYITTTERFVSSLKEVESVVLEGEQNPDIKTQFELGFKNQKESFDSTIKSVKEFGDANFKAINQKVITFESIIKAYKKAVVHIDVLVSEKKLDADKLKQKRAALIFSIYNKIANDCAGKDTFIELSDEDCESIALSVFQDDQNSNSSKEGSDSKNIKSSEKVSELENSLKEKVQRILDLETEIAAYNAKLKLSEQAYIDLDSLRATLDDEIAKSKKLADEFSQTQIERDATKEMISKKENDFKKKEAELRREIESLKNSLAETNNQLRLNYNEKLGMQVVAEQGQREASMARQELLNIKSKLNMAEEKAYSSEQSLKRSQEEVMAIKNKQSDADKELFLLNQKIKSTEMALEDKSSSNRVLQEDLKSKSSLYEQLKLENEMMQQKISAYKIEVENAKNKIKSLHSDLWAKEQESLELKIKIEMLFHEQEVLKKKLLESGEVRSELEREKRKLERELQRRILKLSKKENEVKSMQEQKDKLSSKISKVKERLASLEDTGQTFVAEHHNNSEKLAQEVERLNSKLSDVSAKLSHSISEKDELQKGINVLKTETSKKLTELENLKKDHVGLQDKFQSLDQKLKDNESLWSKNLVAQKNVEDQIKEVSKLQDKAAGNLNSLEKKNDSVALQQSSVDSKNQIVLPPEINKVVTGGDISLPKGKESAPPLPKNVTLQVPTSSSKENSPVEPPKSFDHLNNSFKDLFKN